MKIKRLTIKNFKVIVDKTIDFDQDVHAIVADNGKGKTTTYDAYLWLMTGKDSSDSSNFGIKRRDENRNDIPRLDIIVEGEFEVNGKKLLLRKEQREVWKKKRGADAETLEGNEVSYFINGASVLLKEYSRKIEDLFSSQDLVKILTNVYFFNSKSYGWKERRKLLTDMSGEVDFNSILAEMEQSGIDCENLREELENGNSLESYRSRIITSINNSKKRSDELDIRLKEASRSIIELEDVNYYVSKISELKAKVSELIESKSNVLKFDSEFRKSLNEHMSKIDASKRMKSTIVQNIESDKNQRKSKNAYLIQSKKSELEASERKLNSLNPSSTSSIEFKIEEKEERIQKLRAQYTLVFNDKFIVNDDFICKSCGQKLTENDIHVKSVELEEIFNLEKAARLEGIKKSGELFKAELSQLQEALDSTKKSNANIEELKVSLNTQIDNAKNDLTILEEEKARIQSEVIDTADHTALIDAEILELEKSIPVQSEKQDVTGIDSKIKEIETEISDYQEKINAQKLRSEKLVRIEELNKELKDESEVRLSLENELNTIDEYQKLHSAHVENSVNSMFKIAKFSLFEKHLNGNDNFICKCTLNGVDYEDCSYSEKIKLGLDIINTISQHFAVFTPIFVDNSESIQSIPECKSQLILLKVTQN